MSDAPQTITVRIDKDGNVKIHVENIPGGDCTIITSGLESKLGGDVVDRTYTDEYFQAPASEDEHTHAS